MDKIKGLVSRQTRHGRAIRTAIQGLITVLSFVAGLLAIPGLYDALTSAGFAVQVGTIAAWLGIVSYIQNALEDLISWLDN